MDGCIREALQCSICLDTATLPVHGLCCSAARSANPCCMHCVRGYMKLNEPIRMRALTLKSWSGCGHDVNPRLPSRELYDHTTQLDMVRNMIGPSVCHNCGASCSTVAELRRHVQGIANRGDKNDNCQKAIMMCRFCNFRGMRCIVEGEHFDKMHKTVYCEWCEEHIKFAHATSHLEHHQNQLATLHNYVTTFKRKIQ